MGRADYKKVHKHRLHRVGCCQCVDCGPAKRQGKDNRRIERARLTAQLRQSQSFGDKDEAFELA